MLHIFKGYGSCRLLAEFPDKNWTKGGLDTLMSKLQETCSTDTMNGSGRPKCAHTEVESVVVCLFCFVCLGFNGTFSTNRLYHAIAVG